MKEQIQRRAIEQMEAAKKMERWSLVLLFGQAAVRMVAPERLHLPRTLDTARGA